MAAVISIQVGAAAPVEVTFPVTNQKAVDTITKFCQSLQLTPDTATIQEMGEAAIRWFALQLRDKSILKAVEDGRAANRAAAEATYGLE